MKKKHVSWFLFSLVLISSLILPKYTFGNTVLGESIFPVEEGDEFIWEKINATEPWDEFDFVRFTVEKIYNETYNSENYLFLNYTLEFYHRTWWIPRYENSFYMAFNKTLNFLNWSEDALIEGYFFIFPIPINLSLIQESIDTESPFNTSIIGEKLVFDYGNNTIIEHTIDSSGFSKVIEKITNDTTIFRWELNEEKVIVRIPLGISTLYFTGIGILFLVIFNLVKMKRTHPDKLK